MIEIEKGLGRGGTRGAWGKRGLRTQTQNKKQTNNFAHTLKTFWRRGKINSKSCHHSRTTHQLTHGRTYPHIDLLHCDEKIQQGSTKQINTIKRKRLDCIPYRKNVFAAAFSASDLQLAVLLLQHGIVDPSLDLTHGN